MVCGKTDNVPAIISTGAAASVNRAKLQGRSCVLPGGRAAALPLLKMSICLKLGSCSFLLSLHSNEPAIFAAGRRGSVSLERSRAVRSICWRVRPPLAGVHATCAGCPAHEPAACGPEEETDSQPRGRCRPLRAVALRLG